jgi:CBS domain-containing protein
MSQPPQRLVEIAEQLKAGQNPSPETVRTLLSWFGVQKRGSWIRRDIRATLKRLGIVTVPDFESVYIDVPIEFVAVGKVEKPSKDSPEAVPVAVAPEVVIDDEPVIGGTTTDPTYRISRLASANRSLVTVKPETPLSQAITLMLMHDYSQLPVMTGERDVKGVISWASIGQRLVMGTECHFVRDCMEKHHEVSADVSIFTAITAIVQHQYVLVRGAANRITGIVTTSDLSLQFHQLAEPFLLIGEIENQIRLMIEGRFTKKELAEVRDPGDAGRAVESVSDLTFGEYQRLLENPDRWRKVSQQLDRNSFIERLDRVRDIRNDVMHFDPDGLPSEELELLRDFVRFLRHVKELTHKK